MQTNVELPQVELTMDQVVVAKWLVEIGHLVQPEQPLVTVETQKATTEVRAPCKGYVRKLFVKEGEMIGEKALLCVLTDSAEEHFVEPTGSLSTDAPTAPAAVIAPSVSGVTASGSIKAAPAARRVAKDLGIALSTIIGTGPGGRIVEEDVRARASALTSGTSSSIGEWTRLSATRLALIAQMQKSLTEIPQIHLSRLLDVTALSTKADGITFTHRLVAASAQALREHPSLRTTIVNDRIRVEPVSVAVAIDTPHGLFAPAIRRADQMSVVEISVAMKEFRARAQSNGLHQHELINAPFAVTNLGMLGIDFFAAFVFHGQTAVLSVGRTTEASAETKVAWFGLAADHRVVDGAEGARFLETLQSEIRKA